MMVNGIDCLFKFHILSDIIVLIFTVTWTIPIGPSPLFKLHIHVLTIVVAFIRIIRSASSPVGAGWVSSIECCGLMELVKHC